MAVPDTNQLIHDYGAATTDEARERIRALLKQQKRGLHEASKLARRLAEEHEAEERRIDAVLWPKVA